MDSPTPAAHFPYPLYCQPQMTMSTCMAQKVRGVHQFKIVGYSLHKGAGAGTYIASGIFKVAGHKWTIRLYPDGDDEDDGYVSIYLELVNPKNDVKAFYSFQFDDPKGKSPPLTFGYNKPDIFNSVFTSWGYRRFMEIRKFEGQFLMDDRLTLQCNVEVVKESHIAETKNCFIKVPPTNICQHFLQFLKTKQGTDVTFQVAESTFDAHKIVLAMRSPVFNAEFFGPMKEKKMHIIKIEDMEAPIFKALLHFIYTDTLPPLDDLAYDSADKVTITELAHRLLVAADRYDLERMRLMCENILCENIDVETAATTLKLADQHHCHNLKSFCIRYIASPDVLNDVMATEGFMDLQNSCPFILQEILEKLGDFYKSG